MAPARPGSVVEVGDARFSVLTPSLIRMEYSPTRRFRDEATQVVINRDFPVPEFSVSQHDGRVEIRTEKLRVTYRGGPFGPSSLSVAMLAAAQNSHNTTWHYGDPEFATYPMFGNQGGTARTLDEVDGEIALEPGLISSFGYSTLDDSDSLFLTRDGWVAAPEFEEEDLYFFGYGLDHAATLRAFFHLTGPSPLLPKKTLGNWWSRFHAYSAEEYLGLMDSFAAARVPMAVAVVDTDWHLVDIDPALGTGWTGYTWNPELFPDPEAFLDGLHERGMLTTLNVHPADGVRRHEDAYEQMAAALGLDPQVGEEIAFNIADRRLAKAYFEYLHHPHEEAGVDFWWVDWQSGAESGVAGLDPLWMLNFLHYTDNAREGKRPVTFSRYAGPGSHRYPIGFSGDTIISWESLAFQPYFTAAAANIGYFWWSHDIGGHMLGVKNNELATRWVQFGVFSPVMRLHSSNSLFGSKEPWMYGAAAASVQEEFLRLRHRLVPYLYTAMWDSFTSGTAPVRPMHYEWPQPLEAYAARGQYMFGPDILVAPIVEPGDPVTGLGSVDVWLPPGEWIDFFTAVRYRGGRRVRMFRPLESIPVLVRSGALVPLAVDPMAPIEPFEEALEFVVFPGSFGAAGSSGSVGSSGSSECWVSESSGHLVEDNGALDPAKGEVTWWVRWEDAGSRDAALPLISMGAVPDSVSMGSSMGSVAGSGEAVAGASGDAVIGLGEGSSVLINFKGSFDPGVPSEKTVTLRIPACAGVASVSVNGRAVPAGVRAADGSWVVELGKLEFARGLEVRLEGVEFDPGLQRDLVFGLLRDAQIAFMDKEGAWREYEEAVGRGDTSSAIPGWVALDLPTSLLGALVEVVGA